MRRELQGQQPDQTRNFHVEQYTITTEALITRLKRFGLEPVNVAYHSPEGKSLLVHPHNSFPTHTIAAKLSSGCKVTIGFEIPKSHGMIGSVRLSTSANKELLVDYDSEINKLVGRSKS